MSKGPSKPSCEASAPDSILLAELVDEIAERLQKSENVDIEHYVGLHPNYERALRAAFESLLGMQQFVEQGDDAAADGEPKQLGDYRLVREIGRGGMGVVYEAHQLSLNRRVALKVLPFAALLDQRQLERFKNEARAAAMLKHPHIVSVHAIGCERGAHFFAMELVEGQSLAEVIRQLCSAGTEREADGTTSRVKLEPPDEELIDTSPVAALSTQRHHQRKEFYRSVARLGIQAAEALHAAHQEGVVHRDVKPSNLLIDQDGNLWVTDFGLARIQTDEKLTMTGDLVGTLRYMSPEQADPGRRVMDHRTDIYSLGISLYELLTLRPAFGEMDQQRILQDVLERELSAPRSLDGDIPRDLETIVLKASTKEAADRYATAAELAEDLRRFLEQRPIIARRSSRMQNAWRWAKRYPALAVVSALALSLLIVLAIAGPLAALQQARLSQARLDDLYAAEMQKALSAYEHNDFLLVDETLRRYLADDLQHLRGFEWYCLWHHTRRQLGAPTRSHNIIIGCVDVAPDDRTFVMANWFGKIECCDAVTMERIWTVKGRGANGPGHDDWVLALCYTPDGRIVASGGRDKSLKFWNAQTGALLLERKFEQVVSALAISQSNVLAVGLKVYPAGDVPGKDHGRVDVLLFEIQRKNNSVELKELGQPLKGAVNVVKNLSFSPDGDMLAAATDAPRPLLWRVGDQQPIDRMSDEMGPVLDVDFSPDGSQLATASGIFDGRWIAGQVSVIDVTTGQRVWNKRDQAVRSVDYSPGGDLLAAGLANGKIRIFKTADGTHLENIGAHTHVIRDVAFAHQSDTLLSVGYDDTVRRWNVERRPPNNVLRGHLDVYSLDFSADSRWLAAASHDAAKVWNVERGSLWKQLATPGELINAVCFQFGSDRLVSGGGPFPTDDQAPAHLSIWDSRTGTLEKRLTGIKGKVWRASISPDGKRLLTSGYCHAPTVWNMATGDVLGTLDLQADETINAWYSPSGKFITTTLAWEDAVALWDADNLARVKTIDLTRAGDTGDPYCIAISRDETLLAVGGWGDEITLWSLPAGRHVGTLIGHRQTVLSLDFTPDGRRLASGSCDRTVRIWNMESMREVMAFRDQAGWVWAVKFSPDGRTLAIGSSAALGDDNLVLWRAATEEEVVK